MTIEEFKRDLAKLTLPPPESNLAGWYDERARYRWLCCKWCGQ